MREKELFDQMNLKFSSLQVYIGDFLQVISDGSFWKKNTDYPGRKLKKGEMLLVIEKTPNEDWIIVVDSIGEIGEVCIRVFEKEE